MLNDIDLVEEVCPTCFKFLQSVYDKKRMKNVRQIVVKDSTKQIITSKTARVYIIKN